MFGCVLALSVRSVDSPVAETRAAHARFLIQATFGPTRDAIDELDGPYAADYGAWIDAQMDLPLSSHREFYRSRLNPRISGQQPLKTVKVGAPKSPCSLGSRWLNFAFSRHDEGKAVKISNGVISIAGADGVLAPRTEIDSAYTGNGLPAPEACDNVYPDDVSGSSGGRRRATCASDNEKLNGGLDNGWKCNAPGSWRNNMYCKQSCFERAVNDEGFLLRYAGTDCSSGWPNLTEFEGTVCFVEEGVGGAVKLLPASASFACDDKKSFRSTSPSVIMVNPSIWFANSSLYSDVTGTLTFTPAAVGSSIHAAGEIMALSRTDDSCDLPFFSRILYDGKFYLNDPRLDLLENTVENPAITFGETCPTVTKSWVNKASCKLVKTCMPLSFRKSRASSA